MSSSNTDSTTDSVSTAASVSVVCAKLSVSSLPNVDSLSNAIDVNDLEDMDLRWQMAMLTMRARSFLQKTGKNLCNNRPTSMGFYMSKVECYNCHRKGHFTRECRSPKDSRRNGVAEPQRRTVPVETSTSNALVSQCDCIRSFDWSYQAEEKPANFALMASSPSSTSFDNEVPSCSKACSKAYAQLHSQYDKLTNDFRKSQFDVLSYQAESNYESCSPSSLSDRSQPIAGYHVVPSLITGTFMPPKPDLVLHIAPITVESDHFAFIVQLSPLKPAQDLSHTNRPFAHIIEDWVSDSEDESETTASQNVPSFVQSSEKVKTPRHSIQPAETSIPIAIPKPSNPKSNRSGKRKNRKNCFVCESVDHLIKDCNYHAKKKAQPTPRNYAHRGNNKQNASLTHKHPQSILVPAAVLTQSKPVSITAVRPVRNMSYLSEFEELKGGYVAFGGNPKGGKIYGKGKIKTGKLDFEDVYFVKELKFNLFSVSQMCGKKNSVLFTDTGCLVLSPDFKLPDESQVLLKVPRENNMYNINLENIVPSGDLNCLFAKEIIDESNFWHRRLGHINFKTIYKLVKGNLVRGLPTKVFENNNTCVACKKGKQHRASCKTKPNRVLVTKPHNKTPYELLHGRTPSIGFMRPFGYLVTILNTLDSLGKFEGKVNEGFLVGYSVNSKAFRVFNSRTRIIQETLHVNFLENKPNITCSGPTWLFNIDSLTRTMNYQPVTTENQTNPSSGFQDEFDAEKEGEEINQQYVLFPVWFFGSTNPQNYDADDAFNEKEHDAKKPDSEVDVSPSSSAQSGKQDDKAKKKAKGKSHVESSTGYRHLSAEFEDCSENNNNEVDVVDASQLPDDPDMPELEDITYYDDENVGAKADFNNLETSITVSPIPTTRIHKDHPVDFYRSLMMTSILACFHTFFHRRNPRRNKARFVAQGHTHKEGIDYEEVFALVARIKAIRLFLAYASFMGFLVYQMDVKNAFLYGTIEEEVYVCQPPGFEDPENPDKVYKVVKARYGLHQAPRAWKFGLSKRKPASTPIDAEKPLLKDSDEVWPKQLEIKVDYHICLMKTFILTCLLVFFHKRSPNESIKLSKIQVGLKPCKKSFFSFWILVDLPYGKRAIENKPNITCSGPTWLFNIDSLTRTMNYQPVTTENQTNPSSGFQDEFDAEKEGEEINQQYVLFPVWFFGSTNPQNYDADDAFNEKEHDAKKPDSEVDVSPSSSAQSGKQDDKAKKKAKGKSHVESSTGYRHLSAEFEDCSENNNNEVDVVDASQLPDDPDMPELEDITYYDDENVGAKADFNNLETSITVSPIPTTRIHKDHPEEPKKVHQALKHPSWIEAMQEELLQFKMQKVEGFDYEEVFAPVARIKAIRLFLAYASFMGFMVYQMDVKSAFICETIEEEVYVCQPPGFEDPDHPDKVYKVVKALCGLHQAPRAWSMIGSLMYLTSLKPDIMFACKKQTVVATSSTEAEYVAAASCCAKFNDVTRLQALVDKKKVVVTEDAIREVLQLDYAEGVNCLPNKELFADLARMGYEKPSTKLTFYKAFFSSQWNLWRNVDSTSKFYMYPYFLQLLIRKQVGDLSTHTTKYASPALTQKVFANMRRVGKGFFRVETPLFEGMLVGQEIEEGGDAEEHVEDVTAGDATEGDDTGAYGKVPTVSQEPSIPSLTPPTLPPHPPQDLPSTSQEEDKKVDESAQAKVVENDQKDEPTEVQEVVDVVTTAKLITEPQVPAATITDVPVKVTATPSRRRKRVVMRDPEVESTTSLIIPIETKSKDKSKGILVEEPKPLKKKQQVKMDKEYVRKLHAEINKYINWDVAIDHVKLKAKEDLAVQRYQAMKRKPQTEAQARKNMMMYLKNVAGFKLDYFKGMSYDDIRPIFEAKFNLNIEFLLKTKEQMEEEESRALQRINETLTERATKRRKLNEEIEDLKIHLEIMPDEDDDVYTEATPLARKVPVVDYEIINLNNKPYYKIIRADGTH
uniref:Putative ribonuclease H-like domain-containing protein n=1 Tax=Tanacetum cinerariifolium TaxID=118510 RepID=A0A6L2L7G2_TANCI|nr:putative ribonuclease H-like domain-containing protein [Tanacetum cinerariifolium]